MRPTKQPFPPRRRSNRAVVIGVTMALAAPALVLVLLSGMALARIVKPGPTPAAQAATISPTALPVEAAAAFVSPGPSASPATLLTPTPTSPGPVTAAMSATATPTPTSPPPAVSTPSATFGLTSTPSTTSAATPTLVQATTPPPNPEPASATPTETTLPPTATLAAATGTATATPTSTLAPGWSFVGVTLIPDEANDTLLVYGDAVNNTGSTQHVTWIRGTFFDDQGQEIAGPLDTVDRTPTGRVPNGGRLPFELLVLGIHGAARHTLEVQAQADSQAVRENFEFFDTSQSTHRGQYCVTSTLRRPEPALAEYLVVAAVLLDEEGDLIGLSEPYEPDLDDIASAPDHTFTLCAEPPLQSVGGYQLRAWGR